MRSHSPKCCIMYVRGGRSRGRLGCSRLQGLWEGSCPHAAAVVDYDATRGLLHAPFRVRMVRLEIPHSPTGRASSASHDPPPVAPAQPFLPFVTFVTFSLSSGSSRLQSEGKKSVKIHPVYTRHIHQRPTSLAHICVALQIRAYRKSCHLKKLL